MKKLLIVCAALLSLSACTTMRDSASVGALGGGVVGGAIGAATTGTVAGTVVGAGVGALAGAILLGAVDNSPGRCYYRTPSGRTVIDVCPEG